MKTIVSPGKSSFVSLIFFLSAILVFRRTLDLYLIHFDDWLYGPNNSRLLPGAVSYTANWHPLALLFFPLYLSKTIGSIDLFFEPCTQGKVADRFLPTVLLLRRQYMSRSSYRRHTISGIT